MYGGLLPDRIFDDIYKITPDFLAKEGIRALILDIDNTLVTYDDPKPTASVREWLDSMKRAGIEAAFVSNNNADRVALFLLPRRSEQTLAQVPSRGDGAYGQRHRNYRRSGRPAFHRRMGSEALRNARVSRVAD